MATRSKSQQIGSQGQRLVEYIIESSKEWIARNQDEDYALDLEAELSAEEVSGEIIKIQVKSSEAVKKRSGMRIGQLPKSLVNYSTICRIPIVLVIVDTTEENAWYLWIQKWLLLQRRDGVLLQSLPESITIEIPEDNTLQNGLKSELKDVAKFSTNEQLILSLNDTIKTASFVRSIDVLAPLVQIMSNLESLYDDFPVELVIDEVVSLGSRIWVTHEGNRVTELLFSVCRELGDSFNAKHIKRLVQRDDSYSRTGLNALGILYNKFPEHIKLLGLPSLFIESNLIMPAYYCNLRERYLGTDTASLFNSNTDFTIDGLTIPNEYRDDLFFKWVNRGDSAILDYVVEV